MRQVIYVSGPIRAPTLTGIETNVYKAVDVGIKLWKMGHFPLVPHLTHWLDLRDQQITPVADRLTWADYMEADYEFLRRADALYFVGHSPGADLELAMAQRLGMPIYYSLDEVPVIQNRKQVTMEELYELFLGSRDRQTTLAEYQ